MALVLAFTDDTPSASDATTYTFSTQSIGTAASDRYVLVGITARAAATRTISSVTIAGESATQVVFDGTGNTLAAYYIALVTTGTTGDVVVTFSGAMVRCAIAVYAMTGVDPTPADTATSTADPATVNLDIPAGGAAFGLAATGTEPASIAWTNLTADAYLFDTAGYENNNAVGFASDKFASAQTALALTGDFASATSVPNSAFCSFGPASGGGTTITGALGTATASGHTGTVNANRTIAGALGTASASGLQGGVNANTTIAGALGTAVASGLSGTVSNTNDTVIGGTLGIAIASGLMGTVNASTVISGNLGTAVASGLTGTVSNGTTTDLALILKILSNRQELNATTGKFTLYDDDGVTVLYESDAWEDTAGTIPYRGKALRRIDALA